MRAKFVALFAYLLCLIFRAERNPELEDGEDKLYQVLHGFHLKAVQLSFLPSVQSQFPKGTVEAIIALIKAVVALLNLFGVFQSNQKVR